MAANINCWEFKKCGREPGGARASELGVCPAATEGSDPGPNDGKFSGRLCWAVAGTFCGGKVQGTTAEKQLTCMSCDFFKVVKEELGARFQLMNEGQAYKSS